MNSPTLPIVVPGITSNAYVAPSSSASPFAATSAGNYLQIYGQQNATGDTRAAYLRLYANIAAASGESLRAYGTVNAGIAADTFRGAHISLGFGALGYVTGLGTALTTTLELPNEAMHADGTYAAVNAEIYSGGSTTDPAAVTEMSVFRGALNGDATGAEAVDDVAYLMTLDGATIASGNIVVASTTEANYAWSARCKLGGQVMYMMFASATG